MQMNTEMDSNIVNSLSNNNVMSTSPYKLVRQPKQGRSQDFYGGFPASHYKTPSLRASQL